MQLILSESETRKAPNAIMLLFADNLAPLNVVVVLCAIPALLCLSFVAQRVYYRIRTNYVEAIDTMHLRIVPDLLCFVVGAAFALLTWGALATYSYLESFEALADDRVARVLEVAEASERSLTLVTHKPKLVTNQSREAILVSSRPAFRVRVENVAFRELLKSLGIQPFTRLQVLTDETRDENLMLRPEFPASLFLGPPTLQEVDSPLDLTSGDVYQLIAKPEGLEFQPTFNPHSR